MAGPEGSLCSKSVFRVTPVSLRSGKKPHADGISAVACGRARDPGESTAARARDGLLKIPREPHLWGFRHGGGVLLEGHKIVERVYTVQFAGVDEAHVNIAYSGPVQRFKAQGVFSMEYRHFESTFCDVVIQRGARHRKEPG